MRNLLGMGGHQRTIGANDEWLTPPAIIKALGPFDLDPCAPITRPWDTAGTHFSLEHDGLSHAWFGSVWLNPPYGLKTALWLAKLARHGCGIALIFARTETRMFFKWVWGKASAILFLQGRIHFHHVDGSKAAQNAGAPSVLIAYGMACAKRLRSCNIPGHFVNLEAA